MDVTMEKQPGIRYGRGAQTFHWLTAVLGLATFLSGPGGSELRAYLPQRDFVRQLHETLGCCALAIVTLGVLWRMVETRPVSRQLPFWMELAARSVQVALHALLFALPITAVAGAWLEGHPLTLLAGGLVSPPFPPSHALGVAIATFHRCLGDTLMLFAGAHALAGLGHHFVMRDSVLVAMLPRWFPLRPSR